MANEEVTREEIAAAINDIRRCQHHWLPESIDVLIAAASQSRPAPDRGQDACPFCGGDELNTYDNEYRSRAIARLNNIARGQIVEECANVEVTLPSDLFQKMRSNAYAFGFLDGDRTVRAAIRALAPAPAQTEDKP